MNSHWGFNDSLKAHLVQALSAGIRFDGRAANEFRKVDVEYGISKSAEGSARVRIGGTEVFAGVKMEIMTPYPDTPNVGSLMVNAELLPMSNPIFEPGPPGIDAIEVARVVDRGIREAKAIDVKKLCITPGEKAWMVIIDVCTVNDCGNLLDAAGLAAMAALQDAVFPAFDGKELDYKTKTDKRLPIDKLPLPVTVYKIGKSIIVDPITEEEMAFDARLTVTTLRDGKICAMQKGGDAPLSIDDVDLMTALALEKAQELRKIFKQ